MANISAFKAQMQGGGARPNQFRVLLTFPGAPIGSDFLCKSTTLPASTIEDITTMYRGRPVHFAGERSFAPWTVTVYNDTDFKVRSALEAWSSRILNYTATNGSTAPSSYYADLSVMQLDRNDQILKTYEFKDAYPISIGQIGLDYEANNQIETFDVEFVYNYFTVSSGTAGASLA